MEVMADGETLMSTSVALKPDLSAMTVYTTRIKVRNVTAKRA